MTDTALTADAPQSETAGPGPLAGVRVVELGMLLAGPFTGRLLGDMGAEIIKVEPPGPARPAARVGQGALPRGARSGGRCSRATRSA